MLLIPRHNIFLCRIKKNSPKLSSSVKSVQVHFITNCLSKNRWTSDSVDPDQTSRFPVSDLCLNGLLKPGCSKTYGNGTMRENFLFF